MPPYIGGTQPTFYAINFMGDVILATSSRSVPTSSPLASAIDDALTVDHHRIRIRAVLPTDQPFFEAGFRRLSARSRRQRFGAAKTALSATELRTATDCDGRHHLALGAVLLDTDGREIEGIGVARCIRLTHLPRTAELAITIADHWQHLGLGVALLERLALAAAAQGIDAFNADLSVANGAIQRLLNRCFPATRFIRQGSELTAVCPFFVCETSRQQG